MCGDGGSGKMARIDFTVERPSDFPLHFIPSSKNGVAVCSERKNNAYE